MAPGAVRNGAVAPVARDRPGGAATREPAADAVASRAEGAMASVVTDDAVADETIAYGFEPEDDDGSVGEYS